MGLAWAFLAGHRAEAAPVTAGRAADAVTGWLRLDRRPLGAPLSAQIKRTETVSDAAGPPLYYVVHLDPSGYVIVPADDMAEPIVAFSASGRFDSTSSDPAALMANRDLPRRMARARAGQPNESAVRNHRKWKAALFASPNPPPDSEENGNIVIASQVWVAPFVQTLWSQTTDVSLNYACYNYFTPPYGAGAVSNYYCGCVATCLAQLMYYYQYPTVGVGTNSFAITVNGSNTAANLRGGDGNGGPYQWANMPLNPNAPTTAQAQAIGALCFDAAVAVNMDFEAGGSSAAAQTEQQALVTTFKFANAGYYENDASGVGGTNLLAMINPNLDARLPVSLAIYGPVAGGHCLVADGYGYSGSTLFHHLNPGWAGDDDIWYALPEINTSDNGEYTIVQACIYNLYSNGAGQIISGRVTDPTGAPVAGATVTAVRNGGTNTATTDTNGIYALVRVQGNSQYTLTVASAGYTAASGNYTTGQTTYNAAVSGNVWGANFTLSPPLLAIPENGFAAIGPFGGPFSVTTQTYTLTNTTGSAVSWSLAKTASWLNVTATNGSLAAGAASSLGVSLNAAASSLTAGTYPAAVWLTNLNNHLAQALPFSLAVRAADYPISVTGFNADVVVENDATGGNAPLYALPFDPANSQINPASPTCFYEAGLVTDNLGGSETAGLPPSGLFTSAVDSATTFQFGPYTSNNVLYLVLGSNAGSLTLPAPAAYKSLSVLAATAEGGGAGSLVIHFADGSASSAMSFNASNFVTSAHAAAGAALTNFGTLICGDYNEFYCVDNAADFIPALYQTSINLLSQGLHTKAISSVTFTMPAGGNTNTVTGIFALSGTESPFPIITAQPQSAATGSGGNVTLSVGVTGAATLSYHWYLNGAGLSGTQSNSLNLTGVGAANAGSYQVVVTNNSGAVTSAVSVVSITNEPVAFVTGPGAIQLSGGKLALQLTNLTGQGAVVISASANLLQWVPVYTNPSGFGTFTYTDTVAGQFPRRYYRAITP